MRALFLVIAVLVAAPAFAQPLVPFATDGAEARALVERARAGGLVFFFRHADTIGMPCDRSFRVGDREGQRNISPAGERQSRAIGRAFAELGIPVAMPVLAGPVYRARDTAEHAFGAANTRVTDELLADDYSGARLAWVLDALRRLFTTPVTAGTNRLLFGHRTPAIMVLGPTVGQRAFPEGAAIVMEPAEPLPRVLGIWMPAPIAGAGFHGC